MISAALAILDTDEQRNELSEFYEEDKKRFYAIAFSKLHNREAAEDAVQEAFLRFADKPENFFEIPLHKRVAFADVIIRNISVDMFKRQMREDAVDNDSFDNTLTDHLAIEDIIVEKELYGELVEFIRKLPEAKKSALVLRIIYKKSTAKIAETLNISETAARKRLSDAGKLIKDFLRSRNDETIHT